ncbi:MAG: hypothetical protein ABJD53_04500 [Gammaproteobacteria bacterium]
MSITIQEVALKGFSVALGDDSIHGRISLEGSKGEMILLTCPMDDLVAMAQAFAQTALADLVRLGKATDAAGALLHRRTATAEDHVAARIQVVGEGAAHVLVVNTLEDKQLRILLMPAQRDAVLQALV